MRRRVAPRPTTDGIAVPEPLIAGQCLEVWSPGGRDGDVFLATFRPYSDARSRWLWHALGAGPWDHHLVPAALDVPLGPWSWMDDDRDRRIAERGLPADWRPSPAHPDNFGDPLPLLRWQDR